MQVCLSLKEYTVKQLDDMISQGIFPAYVTTRSSAIAYLISQAHSEQELSTLELYDRNFR